MTIRRKHTLGLILIVFVLAHVWPAHSALADPGKGGPECTTANANSAECTDVGIYGVEMRALAAEMAAHPRPEVTPLAVDERELYSRAYRRVLKETPVYDAPNGNVVGQIDAGFNFVNAGRVVDGWAEIRAGQWLPEKVLGPVNKAVSRFAGVLLPNGMPERPFGWLVLDSKPSRFPGAKPAAGTPELKRYTLLNIFAVERVEGWEWYLIGPDQWIVQTRMATLKPAKRPEGVSGKWFAVDLYEQTLIAYDNDRAVYATLISSGLPQWGTNLGLTRIWERHELVKMSGAGGQVDFYYLPEVPWVMYFNPDEEALHGAYWHDGFGYRHSHGCVNMSITDAMWAFKWTQDAPNAWVYVYESGEYRKDPPR